MMMSVDKMLEHFLFQQLFFLQDEDGVILQPKNWVGLAFAAIELLLYRMHPSNWYGDH